MDIVKERSEVQKMISEYKVNKMEHGYNYVPKDNTKIEVQICRVCGGILVSNKEKRSKLCEDCRMDEEEY